MPVPKDSALSLSIHETRTLLKKAGVIETFALFTIRFHVEQIIR